MENLTSFAKELWKLLQNHTYFVFFSFSFLLPNCKFLLNLEGEKSLKCPLENQQLLGQSTGRPVQPSIGVRLFMTQSSSAWGGAGGTSDHFHPSGRRHRERHKQKNGQSLRKDFPKDAVCAPSCTEFYFRCLREHLASYFTPESVWSSRSKWRPSTCMKRDLERMNGGDGTQNSST